MKWILLTFDSCFVRVTADCSLKITWVIVMGGIMESGHKNGIYCIKWNVMEFVKVCMN